MRLRRGSMWLRHGSTAASCRLNAPMARFYESERYASRFSFSQVHCLLHITTASAHDSRADGQWQPPPLLSPACRREVQANEARSTRRFRHYRLACFDEEDYPQQDEYEPPFYVNDEADCGITRSIGGAIQNPQCFFGVEGGQWGHAWDYYYTDDGEDGFKINGVTYINLWSANASEVVTWTDNYYESNMANYKPSPFTIDIKTVYDPCPVGFKVPELADFSHAFDPRHTYSYFVCLSWLD